MTTLPDVIDRYYSAAAAGDLDAIRGWREGAATRFTYTTEITGVEQVGDTTYVVRTHLEGDFPGGVVDLEQRFEVTDGRITDLVI